MQIYRGGLGALAHALQHRQDLCKLLWADVAGVFLSHADILGFKDRIVNRFYWGRSVSFQAVSRWLRGESIPEQDKLLTLAEVLKIEPEVLRFGEAVRNSVRVQRQRWEEGVGYLERETFDAFLQLPAPQRKLIREVILTFAKVHGEAQTDKKG